ncbi:MAG: hypothetical protein ACRC7N_04230 [Clostridium sp.]
MSITQSGYLIKILGKHIYFGDKRSACGGWLDIDMNAGRGHELHPVENIRFANNAPRGHYQFYIHNYCERVAEKTAFKVELEVNGKIYTYKHDGLRDHKQAIAFEFDYMGEGNINIKIDSQSKSTTEEWNISGDFVKVKGITNSPNLWGDNPYTKSGNHIFFLLEGCKDKTEGRGRGFFNEMLQPELYEVRKTLEAYTANTKIENLDNASACGIGFSKDNQWNLTLKVRTNNQERIIKIDRFD